VAANLQTKPANLGCESANKWLLPSISTIGICCYYSARSWYSCYRPIEGGRLSRPRHCRKDAQPVPKAVHRSGCRDKYNWPRPLTPQSIMPSLNHCDLLRHVGVNNLPKVNSTAPRPGIELTACELQVQCLSHCDVGVWPHGWMDQHESWCGGKPQPWPHCVRWGPSRRPKWAQPPIFDPRLLWPNGWMDQDATWYRVRSRPRRHCVRSDPAPAPQKSATAAPIFDPCLLWPNGRPSQQLLSSVIICNHNLAAIVNVDNFCDLDSVKVN